MLSQHEKQILTNNPGSILVLRIDNKPTLLQISIRLTYLNEIAIFTLQVDSLDDIMNDLPLAIQDWSLKTSQIPSA